MRSRFYLKTLVLIALLTISSLSLAANELGHWKSHGNAKWAQKSLTVGQARTAIAMAMADRFAIPGSGLRISPKDIKVTLKLGADGKTALWRANVIPSRGSVWSKMINKGMRVKGTLMGSIDVSLRNPTHDQIKTHVDQVIETRKVATPKSDWNLAKRMLSWLGNKPRETTVRKKAYANYQERTSNDTVGNWLKAEKQLTLDLSGNRVTFIDSSKAFSTAKKALMGAQ